MTNRSFPIPPLGRGPLRDFFTAARLPFQGLGFLGGHPKLWFFVLIPLVLNLILFTVILYFGGGWFADLLETKIGAWGEAAWYWKIVLALARVFFWLVVLIFVYFIFTPVALIIAAPFNDQLAEAAERACGFQVEDDRSIVRMTIEESLFAIASEVKRMAVFGSLFLMLLLLHFAPVLGSLVYAVVSFILGGYAVAFEFTSYAADRRHWPFRRKWRGLQANLPATLGFGMAVLLLLMIPFINVLVFPVAAVSGSFLFCGLSASESPTADH